MSTALSPIFRKSVGGYNKSDVNDYIEEMSLRAKKDKEDLTEKIEKLEKKLEEAEKRAHDEEKRANDAEKRDFSKEAGAFEEKIAELELKVSDGTNLIEAKNELIAKLEGELSAKNDEIDALKKRVCELEEAEKAAADNLRKAKEYDTLSKNIGELMMNAGSTAEKIVSDAGNKATSLIKEAESKRAYCLEILQKYTQKYCDKLNEVTLTTAQERLNRINRELKEFEASISRSVNDAKSKNETAHEYIETLRTSLDISLDSILNMPADSLEVLDGSENVEDDVEKMLDNSISNILSKLEDAE